MRSLVYHKLSNTIKIKNIKSKYYQVLSQVFDKGFNLYILGEGDQGVGAMGDGLKSSEIR